MNEHIRGYYFSQIPKTSVGPKQKVQSQIETFRRNGIEFVLVESPFQTEGIIRGNFFLRQLISRLPFTYVYSRHIFSTEYKNADVYYIRFLAGDRYFVKFLKQLRQNNPNAKIVMELADYPTTYYMTISLFYKIIYFPLLLKDFFAGKQYKKYVDRIALLKPVDKAYDIPTIQFENGIDISKITKRKPCGTEKIKLIAVAAMQNFHGYDRLIEGLREYYKGGGERYIEVHMVGGKVMPGNNLSGYISLANEYGLQNRIVFHGEKIGKELDEMYDTCNMAVASLGMYRIGYSTANSLKIREYLAKGLPIVSGCEIDIFAKHAFPYECRFSNDDTAIDFNKLVDFFDVVYNGKVEQSIISEIRAYAEKNCDMGAALRPIIDYLKKDKG